MYRQFPVNAINSTTKRNKILYKNKRHRLIYQCTAVYVCVAAVRFTLCTFIDELSIYQVWNLHECLESEATFECLIWDYENNEALLFYWHRIWTGRKKMWKTCTTESDINGYKMARSLFIVSYFFSVNWLSHKNDSRYTCVCYEVDIRIAKCILREWNMSAVVTWRSFWGQKGNIFGIQEW